jgi:hypothetical protein
MHAWLSVTFVVFRIFCIQVLLSAGYERVIYITLAVHLNVIAFHTIKTRASIPINISIGFEARNELTHTCALNFMNCSPLWLLSLPWNIYWKVDSRSHLHSLLWIVAQIHQHKVPTLCFNLMSCHVKSYHYLWMCHRAETHQLDCHFCYVNLIHANFLPLVAVCSVTDFFLLHWCWLHT